MTAKEAHMINLKTNGKTRPISLGPMPVLVMESRQFEQSLF